MDENTQNRTPDETPGHVEPNTHVGGNPDAQSPGIASDAHSDASDFSGEMKDDAADSGMTTDEAMAAESADEAAEVKMPGAKPLVGKAEFTQLSAAEGGVRNAANIDLLMDVHLPVSIELGRTRLSISDILELGSGSIVELDKLAGEPVDILVNNKPLAKGEVVVLDENFGVRITSLVSPRERLERLKTS